MSFILDALKKSEAERARQAGPTLLELRITRPRRRYPLWALILGALLAVNVFALLFVALRRPASTAPATPAASAAAPAVATTPAVARAPAVAAPPAAVPPIRLPAPAGTATPPQAAVAPLVSAEGTASAATGSAPATSAAAGAATAAAATARNPADEEPAVAPAPAAAAPAAGTVSAQPLTAADYASLPTLSSLGDSVPALQLNLLVSSTRPAARYALINMRRVHEGDVLPEGARVLAITRDGVAMQYRGQDFLLRPPAAPPAQ